jgi:hypothetical protein
VTSPASTWMRRRGRAPALLACVMTLSCEGRVDESGTQALWSADANVDDNPFPEERTVDDTGAFAPPEGFAFRFMPNAAITSSADVTFAAWDDYVAEAGGWGVAAPIALRFSAPLDASKLRDDAVAFVVERAPVDEEPQPSLVIPSTLRWVEDPGYLLATPVTPLPAGQRIIVGVRRDLDGARLARTEDFVAHAAGSGRNDVDAAALAMNISGGSELALTFAYRTSSPSTEMRDAVALVRAAGVPTHSFDAATAPSDVREDLQSATRDLPDGARVSVGTFKPLDLRPAESARAGWNEGVWDLDVAPRPAGVATGLDDDDGLEILYVLPDATLFPPPWPVVIAQHGFAGDRTFGPDIAAPYVERGLAVLSIDASSHGARGSFLGFLRVDDPRVARDHLRQSVVDVVQLASLVQDGGVDVDGVAGPDFDGTLLFYGHSMGTFVGLPLSQVDDRFTAVALNAPGASFTTLFQGERLSAAVALLLRPALGLTIDDDAYDDALPFCAAVIQTLMEPADALAYVEGHTPLSPPLLLQMALGDRTLPNEGTRVLSRSLGIPTVTAAREAQGDEPFDALWELDPVAFNVPPEEDPHGMHNSHVQIHVQTAEYLASHGRRLTEPLLE